MTLYCIPNELLSLTSGGGDDLPLGEAVSLLRTQLCVASVIDSHGT